MRDVYERGADFLVDLCQLGSHLRTELCVKVGERLVKKEDLRLADDSATQSNTLFLTTGQRLPDRRVEQVGDVEESEQLLQRDV